MVGGKVDGQILSGIRSEKPKILSGTRDEKRKNLFGTKWQFRKILFSSQRVKDSNTSLKQDNNNLKQELTSAFANIDSLEAHDWKANLIITGLPVALYAEAASSQPQLNYETVPIIQIEEAVLELCNQKLGSDDIIEWHFDRLPPAK